MPYQLGSEVCRVSRYYEARHQRDRGSAVCEVVRRVFIIAKGGRRVKDVRNITVAISNELRDITRQISNNLRDIKRATYVRIRQLTRRGD